MLVLENLTFPFIRPNVLDIKLGTQLYDDAASEEKKERMKRVSERTTSGSDGMRISAFKVRLSLASLSALLAASGSKWTDVD